MKNSMLLVGLLFTSTVALADSYDCAFVATNADAKESQADLVNFTIDTNVQENTFLTESGVSVGCVVLRSSPERLACGFDVAEKEQQFQAPTALFVTDIVGASELSLAVSSYFGKRDVQLKCKRI